MHGPSKEWKHDESTALKELLGIYLFFFYCMVYVGFILINVFSPKFMGIDVGSLNVAIVYGFGLIILAMMLAFAYNHVSTRAEEIMDHRKYKEAEKE